MILSPRKGDRMRPIKEIPGIVNKANPLVKSQIESRLKVAALFITLIISVSFIIGSANSVIEKIITPKERATIEANIETLIMLDRKTWKDLPMEKKLSILKLIIQIESDRLGLPETPSLSIENMNPWNGGCYNDDKRTIVINSAYIDEPKQLVETICHESYHAYQYRVAEVYSSTKDCLRNLDFLTEAAVIKENLDNYISVLADETGYYSQPVEEQARTYASSLSKEYFNAISTYLKRPKVQYIFGLPVTYDDEGEPGCEVIRRYYWKPKSSESICVAESWADNIDDAIYDIDSDHQDELFCNCRFFADGVCRLYIYRRCDNQIMVGEVGDAVVANLPGYTHTLAGAVITRWDKGLRKIHIQYCTENGIAEGYYDIGDLKISFSPFCCLARNSAM